MSIDSKWLVFPRPQPQAKMRVICFPYAGGNAATYKTWPQRLASEIEVVAIQLPGRANRISETAFSDMASLIKVLAIELLSILDKPYMIFGHSMGSHIGFELMRELSALGQRLPLHFIASASSAPHTTARKPPIYKQGDEAFIDSLREYAGTPEAVLQNKELMQFLFPLLRADFRLAENYSAALRQAFDCQLSLFSGRQDNSVAIEDLLAWRKHFIKGGELTAFNGGHLFIETDGLLVADKVNLIAKKQLPSLCQVMVT